MFDLFKNRPKDVKEIRNALLQFIKEQLQKTEGGEGSNITGLYLFIHCNDEEKHLYEAAVFYDQPGKFKNEEIQKIADDYAIALPASWILEISFNSNVPAEAIPIKTIDAALLVSTFRNPVIHKEATAYINVLNGEAEKGRYKISSSPGKINIGRGVSVQTADGFFRKNMIAFTDSESNEKNRAVSRQHAHIEWDPKIGSFFLFADEGGIPPNNKIKVRATGGSPVKLMTTQIGHRLQEGDQVILGESAVLEFTFSAE
ncbi:MAG: FHA domain-containing protein [Ferruginibacter sp.]|nr:FHA domain-containing protein [Ferruginibacter sp.]